MKSLKFLYMITFLVGLLGCKTNSTLLIEPIDQELNEQLMTGKGLDTNLFSTKEKFQYYQVDHFENLQAATLQVKLDEYVSKNRILNLSANLERITLFFYKKKSAADYKDQVYRAVQENPDGALEGHHDDVLAKIMVSKQKDSGKWLHDRVVYGKGEAVHAQSDTLSLK